MAHHGLGEKMIQSDCPQSLVMALDIGSWLE
jgi:hypothetical protein